MFMYPSRARGAAVVDARVEASTGRVGGTVSRVESPLGCPAAACAGERCVERSGRRRLRAWSARGIGVKTRVRRGGARMRGREGEAGEPHTSPRSRRVRYRRAPVLPREQAGRVRTVANARGHRATCTPGRDRITRGREAACAAGRGGRGVAARRPQRRLQSDAPRADPATPAPREADDRARRRSRAAIVERGGAERAPTCVCEHARPAAAGPPIGRGRARVGARRRGPCRVDPPRRSANCSTAGAAPSR